MLTIVKAPTYISRLNQTTRTRCLTHLYEIKLKISSKQSCFSSDILFVFVIVFEVFPLANGYD